MDISDELAYSTVRLEVTVASEVSVGTAFFYLALVKNDRGIPILVTNKHVIEGGAEARFVAHISDRDGRPSGTTRAFAVDLTTSVVHHPDPDVDLCAILVSDLLVETERAGSSVFYHSVARELFPTGVELRAVEDVIMIGYPNGLWDSRNNLPISRRGITATSPARDYNGRPEFMIDAACFPGSSGSPVFLCERSAVRPRPNIVVGRRFYFLGVLYAGPVFDEMGCVKRMAIPSTLPSDETGGVMMHLGFVIHAAELLPIEDALQRLIDAAQPGVAAGGAAPRSWTPTR